MTQIPAVFGAWEIKDSWKFVLDKGRRKGGTMLFVPDGCTYQELVSMAQGDYDLHSELVDLSYQLPADLLQDMPPDTPPMFVRNDRQVQSLIVLRKTHRIRLCVSIRVELEYDGDLNDEDHGHENHNDKVDEEDGNENLEDDEEDDNENLEDEEDNVSVGDDDGVKEEDVAKEEEEKAYSDGENYSKYGKLEGEESDDEKPPTFDREGLRSLGIFVEEIPSETDNIAVDMRFSSKDELISELRRTAVLAKFGFRVKKSEPGLFLAICRVNRCAWRLRASVKNEANSFWVTKYVKTHTCSVTDRIAMGRLSTPKYIGKLFMERVGIIDGITPEHIKDAMKTMYGLDMDYTTSYRAMLVAQEIRRGSFEAGYADLPAYLHMIQNGNPGTITHLQRDEQNRFKYLFIAFGASIAGFQYLRRVIVVDGSHLTGKYQGVLLVATAQDGNFQIFPLAFAIVDSENDDAWEWFFTKLRDCVSDEYALTIVSDRHNSIKKACENVFPWATRGICYYHLQNNIVTRFKGKHLLYLVKGAAYAYTLDDFNRYMDEIRRQNTELADYLESAGVSLWSRVHFTGDRYNIKTSNIAESINAALKKARAFPIVHFLDYIRVKLSKWYCKRRADALSLQTPHSRGVEYLLAIREDYARHMVVERIDEWEFNVKRGKHNWVVDLANKSCQCRVYDVEKIPCEHAIAVAVSLHMNSSTLVYPLYEKNYLYSAYLQNIYPKKDGFKAPENVECLPPVVRRPPGRQKKSRYQSWLEIAMKSGPKPRKAHKQHKCSKCHKTGHTRTTCPSKLGGS